VADVMQRGFQTEISFINGGSIRSDDTYGPGNFLEVDIFFGQQSADSENRPSTRLIGSIVHQKKKKKKKFKRSFFMFLISFFLDEKLFFFFDSFFFEKFHFFPFT
jgi:hypothetical protein